MDISAAVDTLLVKPSLKTPYFSFYSNHQRAVEIVSRVQRYFLRDWPWPSAIAKSEYPKHDIDEMALVLCPNAPEDRAEVASAYLSVLFLYDDLLEEMTVVQGKRSLSRIASIFSRLAIPDNMDAVETCIHNLCLRIESLSTSNVSHKLAQNLFDETVRFVEWVTDKQARANSLTQGLDEYMRYRIEDVGNWFTIALTFWEEDILIPDHMREDPAILHLHFLVGTHVVLVNDMYSYRWELKRYRAMNKSLEPQTRPVPEDYYVLYNAVCILQRKGVESADIMDHLQCEVNHVEERFSAGVEALRLKYQVGSEEDLEFIEQWAKHFAVYLAGNAKWSTTCGRYNGVWQNFDTF